MKTRLYTAIVLAALPGGLSVVAGTRVMLGLFEPGYRVLPWLPAYNVVLGLVSLAAAWFIGRQPARAGRLALIIAGSHATVLALLVGGTAGQAAPQSWQAMTFRLAVWLIIIWLIKPLNERK